MQAIVAVLLTLLPLGGALSGEAGGNGTASHEQGERIPPAAPYPGGLLGQAETATVSVENFRFCRQVCRPDSVAYLRSPAGPVPGSDNPRAVINMQPGAPFTWRYRDMGCDVLGCGGHDIRIEDGSGEGRRIGLLGGEAGREQVGWAIPADAAPESIIRYFCARHASFGMTGAFQVLPVGLLTVSYPQLP